MGRPRAIVFDFNGTLSHDEPILCEIFMELFAEHGNPLSAQEYFDELAGLSDPEIVRTWLGPDHPDVDEVIGERIRRYRAAVADGSSVPAELREAVRYAAERVVIDRPVFRADLFDQIDAPAGNLQSAHFHPYFDGIEPCDRHWKQEIKSDPTGWLAGELADLPALLERGGIGNLDPSAIARDAEALRTAIPAVNAAVEAVWDTVRT